MLEVNVDDALQNGRRLAAYTRASIYLYETSILTDGETDIEILNTQPGTQYLHSLLPCSAAIAAACVSSVRRETGEREGESACVYLREKEGEGEGKGGEGERSVYVTVLLCVYMYGKLCLSLYYNISHTLGMVCIYLFSDWL